MIENIDLGDGWKVKQALATEAMDLIRAMKLKYSDDEWVQGDDCYCKDLPYAGPAWHLRILTVPEALADRRKSMLAGPLFTSSTYPWQKTSSGKYAEPIAQIDLKSVSQLRGMPFGDGMLQIWWADSFGVIKTIPRNEIETAELTPVGPTSEEDYDHPPGMWNAGEDVQHIIGYEGPVFSAYTVLGFENRIWQDNPDVARLCELAISIQGNATGQHLFGTFYPIQYRPSDMKLPVLLTIDIGVGNAQIFYRMTDSGPEFSFDWSC